LVVNPERVTSTPDSYCCIAEFYFTFYVICRTSSTFCVFTFTICHQWLACRHEVAFSNRKCL